MRCAAFSASTRNLWFCNSVAQASACGSSGLARPKPRRLKPAPLQAHQGKLPLKLRPARTGSYEYENHSCFLFAAPCGNFARCGNSLYICSAAIDETELPKRTAPRWLHDLRKKRHAAAAALIRPTDRDCLVIGADTTVELNGRDSRKAARRRARARNALEAQRAHSPRADGNFSSAVAEKYRTVRDRDLHA